jgi:hypothetical protein
MQIDRIVRVLKRSAVATIACTFLLSFPAAVTFADDPAPCTPPASTTPGVHWPTGSDASTFVFQCDGQYAGMWTNDHYAYDPATGNRIALDTTTFTYNPATGMWDYTSWDWSSPKGAYTPHTLSVKTPPAGANTQGGPAPSSDDDASSPTTQAALTTAVANGGSGINQTGTFNTTLNNNTGAIMSNVILSGAYSGNADVYANTNGGSATTGNAQAIANIINMLQSSSNVLGDPNMITFTANINGDVNGDLLLDPATLGSMQPGSLSNTLDNNLTINNTTNQTLNNTITLDAGSGDANVIANTNAGNATSGNADAVANIVNILNSAVTAGQSFLGVININGNLNGDILLPSNFVDTLLASNVPHYTVDTSELTNTVTVNQTNNIGVSNDAHAGATSGDATVDANTIGGNATSGLASTNLTVFNLTGSDIVASNDLLVFVNVLGSWYGMIMNAPAGTTAASLGGGVITNSTISNDALNNTNNQAINNHVNVTAETGDATVKDNTNAGNATSGNATASVNLINMINDRLSLNGWFGLLFINVFGSWNGSFGVNTSAGDPITTAQNNSGGAPMFQFNPAGVVPGGSNSNATYSASGSGSGVSNDGVVLAENAVKKAAASLPSTDSVSPIQKAANHMLLPAAGAVFALLILAAGERGRLFRRS